MPEFLFTDPNGKTHSITGPDGATPEQAFQMLQQQLGGKPKNETGGAGTMNALAGGALDLPIVGPAIQGGLQKTAAGIRSMLPGGGAYADELKAVQDYAGKAKAENPKTYLGGQIGGGIAAMGGAGMTATGARLLGLTGSLPQMMLRGGASNAAIGGADALVRGENPVTATAISGGIGAVAPVIGRGIGMAAQPVINTIRGIRDPAGEAARRVASAIERDRTAGTAGLTDAEFGAAANAGAPVATMDMGGETTRALARSAANTSPEGRAALNTVIDPRFEQQSGRLSDWMNTNFHYPNAQAQQTALEASRRAGNNSGYRRAEAASENRNPGGIWSTELERLTSSPDVVDAMKLAATRGKGRAVAEGYGGFNPGVTFDNGMLNFRKGPTGVPSYPDLRLWDYTYRNIRDAADKAFRTGANSEGGSLRAQANALRDAVETHAPEWAQARAGAARHFGAEDALEAGSNYVTARLGNREARQAVMQFTPQERQLFQDGFTSRFIEELRASPDRRSIAHQIINSPEKREKMAIALGPQRASELEAIVRTERIMDLARPAVQGNSNTARYLAELGLAGGANWASGGSPLSTDPQAIMHAALVYGAARGHGAINTNVSRHVAQLLASQNAQQVNLGVRLLARHPTLMPNVRNADAAIGAIVARGVGVGAIH